MAGSGGIGGNFGSDKGADAPGVPAADADEKKRGAAKPAAVASAEVLRNLRRENLFFMAGFSNQFNHVNFSPLIFSA
jgi:hypothetical protein